jgi:hypothetical protein
MADADGSLTGEEMPKITRNQRYHLLNREARLQKAREQYNNDPEVIAKREERERKKAEKEAEKEEKRRLKELELKEKIKFAAETKRLRNGKKQKDSDSPVERQT